MSKYQASTPEQARRAQEYLDKVRLANTPSAHYRRELDPMRPASMRPGSDRLPLFWIAFFVITCGIAAYLGAGL